MAAEAESAAGCDVCKVKCWTSDGFFGLKSFSYKYLCTPVIPCMKGGKAPPPPFIGKDEKLPLLLSLSLGLQHALAMIAGIATSGGLLIAGDAGVIGQHDCKLFAMRSYLVSIAWIASGIGIFMQVFRAKIKGTPYYIGTGMISVMGTSFTFLPVARDMIVQAIDDAQQQKDPRCLPGIPVWNTNCAGVGVEAYGKFLGTCMVGALLEMFFGLLPTKARQKLFPPLVKGIAVMGIGISLIGAGVKYVGGGVFCGENMATQQATGFLVGPRMCNENGEVMLGFGAPEYFGLACSVFFFSIFLQVFGSPFLKSTYLFWSLAFGCIVAAACGYETKSDTTIVLGGCTDTQSITKPAGTKLKYFGEPAEYTVGKADWGVFFWTIPDYDGWFSLGFDGAYLLPILICYWISSAETVGDITMTAKRSEVTDEDEIESRIQGGLLADGLNSFLACCFGSPPNTTFSQNNGVIALTKCASRSAGFSCGLWLCLFGIIGKFGAMFAAIPICVVGGVVLQCFTMVFVTGIEIVGPLLNRRNSFIVMLSLAFAIGVALEPQLFEAGGSFYGKNLRHNYGFWPKKKVCSDFPVVDGAIVDSCTNNNGNCCNEYKEGMKGLRTAILFLLKTPYGIGTIISFVLNLIMPEDEEEPEGVKPMPVTKVMPGSSSTSSSAEA